MNKYTIFNRIINYISILVLLFSIFYIRYHYNSMDIADYDAYAYFTDVYWAGFDQTWMVSEPLSWGGLLFLRALTGSTDEAIVVAHWILGLFTCGFILFAATRFKMQWQGVMLSIAMFGPLLAMVTIRATPAYLLCIAAALTIGKQRAVGLGLAAIAILFHNTAILALGPIAIIMLQKKFPKISNISHSKFFITIFSSLLIIIILFFRNELFDTFERLILIFPGFIQKYLVYFTIGRAENAIGAASQETSIFHILFIAGVSIIFIFYIFSCQKYNNEYVLFTLFSFVIFIMLSGNPVVSYRQSIFWLIPVFLTFPWYVLKPKSAVIIGTLALSAIVFVLNVQGVILDWRA